MVVSLYIPYNELMNMDGDQVDERARYIKGAFNKARSHYTKFLVQNKLQTSASSKEKVLLLLFFFFLRPTPIARNKNAWTAKEWDRERGDLEEEKGAHA